MFDRFILKIGNFLLCFFFFRSVSRIFLSLCSRFRPSFRSISVKCVVLDPFLNLVLDVHNWTTITTLVYELDYERKFVPLLSHSNIRILPIPSIFSQLILPLPLYKKGKFIIINWDPKKKKKNPFISLDRSSCIPPIVTAEESRCPWIWLRVI